MPPSGTKLSRTSLGKEQGRKSVKGEMYHLLLYNFDHMFIISEKNWAGMADKFSFDLRRIKKNTPFFGVMRD